MANKVHINTDGATVKTKGQDLIVSPRRFAMYGAAGLIGVMGLLFLLFGLSSTLESLTDFNLEDIVTNGGLVLLSVGLLVVARFAFNRGRNQQAIQFDTTQQTVKISKDSIINFKDITGVYFKKVRETQLGDLSSIIIQTGLLSGDTVIPVTSISRAELDKGQTDAIELIRLYAQYIGHDPHSIGRDEDLLNMPLEDTNPVFLYFNSTL